jgi:hypothetical protein
MNQQQQKVLEYLRMLDQCYGTSQGTPYVRRVLEHGRFWLPAPDKEQPKRMAPRQCFKNAYQLSYMGHTYCEGWAVPQGVGIGLLHAWVLNEQGQVLEPTWEQPGTAYLGVAAAEEWHMDMMASYRVYEVAGEVNANGIPSDPSAWIDPINALGQSLPS